jgi:2',3'-cyclic-nucleotide 2'-phosphodiesterase (5'-nucleotidase family)
MPWRTRRLATFLLLVAGFLPAEVRSLTILHTNDLHAHLNPLDNGNGGFAYLASVIKHEREGCHDCILLNAGDLVQGSPVSSIFEGLPVYEVGNLLGFDAGTMGNHEFDYGWRQARKFVETARYPIVSSNVVNAKGELMVKPWTILKVNGLRVAVIGATTADLQDLSSAERLDDWRALPVLDIARKYAAELRSQSDLIVLLGHINGEEEKQLLHSAPEIPVIVSGHLHTGMKQPRTEDGRVQVRIKSYTEELGRLELQVDTEKKNVVSWKWRAIPVSAKSVAPDPEVAAAVKGWEDKVTAIVDKPLALSKQHLTKPQLKLIVEYAMREATGADYAYINEGGLRSDLPEGLLMERHIWNVLPFDDEIVVGKFKGRDLPKKVVGDDKIDPDREYTLATTDFVAGNQRTKENLETTGLAFPEKEGLLRTVVIDWFRMKVIEPASR